MADIETGRLAYLILLGIAVVGWFLAQNRESLGKTAQQAVVWGLIFIGVIAGFGLWSDIRDDVTPRQSVTGSGIIEVPRSFDGHYYLVLQINGKSINFVVDTGATDVVLSRSDAVQVGINLGDLIYSGTASTANGVVKTARVRVDEFKLGSIIDKNIPVYVNQGEMDGSLLGMSYLQRFERIEISGNKLILTR